MQYKCGDTHGNEQYMKKINTIEITKTIYTRNRD